MKRGHSIKAALQHLVFAPDFAGKSLPTVIAIHGRGTDENDLVPLVLALDLPNLLLITPRAPFAFPGGGYAWYRLAEEGVPEAETFGTSLRLFRKFVDEVKTGYPVDPERLVLLGFSQGTVVAYASALADPVMFRGIAALSGYIPIRSGLSLQLSSLTNFTVFISHGSNDPLIPVRFGREAAKLLRDAGANVTYREYLMGHEVREDTLRDLKGWAAKTLSAA
jgi:phospholipase/carboxylesterase